MQLSTRSRRDLLRQPLARTLLNEPVVFYRTEEGDVVAMEDRCPHRRLPLSMGKLVGDKSEVELRAAQVKMSLTITQNGIIRVWKTT